MTVFDRGRGDHGKGGGRLPGHTQVDTRCPTKNFLSKTFVRAKKLIKDILCGTPLDR